MESISSIDGYNIIESFDIIKILEKVIDGYAEVKQTDV